MRMADLVRGGIARNTLYAMRDSREVEQLARGLYRLAEMPHLSQSDLVTVAAKSPRAVIYLIMEYASKLRVAKTMRPYLEALL